MGSEVVDAVRRNDRTGARHVCRDVGICEALRLGVGDVMVMLLFSVLAGVYLVYAMLRPEQF
jgi:K+-transporting ATPase KdpF subunit